MTEGPALVIAFGNPLREDDGLGPAAGALLEAALAGAPVQVLTPHQLTPELAEPVSRAGLAVFIDAHAGGGPGGAISEEEAGPGAALGTLAHHQSPGGLLAAAQALYGRCPPAVVFSVAGESFGYRQQLSATVAAVLPELVERVLRRVRAFLAEG